MRYPPRIVWTASFGTGIKLRKRLASPAKDGPRNFVRILLLAPFDVRTRRRMAQPVLVNGISQANQD